jgi:hypothetical protein
MTRRVITEASATPRVSGSGQRISTFRGRADAATALGDRPTP